MSPFGVLFTDQLLLCPWQSSCSAMDKGEFKEKLKQSKNLFPLKVSCALVFPRCLPGGCACSGIQLWGAQWRAGSTLRLPPAEGSDDAGDAPCLSVKLGRGHGCRSAHLKVQGELEFPPLSHARLSATSAAASPCPVVVLPPSHRCRGGW